MASAFTKSAPKKPKLVRDSFTIPKAEFSAIETLKTRAIGLGTSVKKSELIRAGLMALQALDDASYKAALAAVPTLKTGRPMADKPTPKAAAKPDVKAPAKAPTKAAAKSAAKLASKTVANATPKKTAKAPAKPAAKVVTKTATKTATKPATKAVTKAASKPVAKPAMVQRVAAKDPVVVDKPAA